MASPDTQDAEQEEARGSAGGLYALAGFYRQFLGSIAKRITVEEELKRNAGGEECEVFFALEEDDEDALEERRSTSKGGKKHVTRRLIQFKFSRDPRKNQFSPQELNEIAVAFASSKRRIDRRDAGAQVTTTFIVASNRELSEMSLKMIESAKGDGKHSKFQEEKKTEGKPPKRLWTKAAIALLSQIEWEKVSTPSLRVPIEQRAAELGIRGCEVDEAVNRVVQFFFAAVSEGGPQQATIQKIDALLAGATMARPLRSVEARQAMWDGLDQFRESTWVSERPQLHSREAEVALRELLLKRGLIFVYGDGGNGKSSLIYSVLSSGLNATGVEEVEPPFRTACLARHWGPHVLAEHFVLWRGDGGGAYAQEPRQITLERLHAAYGDRKIPLLHLGLDALDEKAADTKSAAIEELLTWGKDEDARRLRGEAALGVLIVTSRLHPRDFHSSFSPFPNAQEKRADEERSLHIDAFNAREMMRAARSLADSSAQPDLQDALRQLAEAAEHQEQEVNAALDTTDFSSSAGRLLGTSTRAGAPMSARAALGGDTYLPPEEEDWLREMAGSLSHPTLWGCFRGLEEGEQLGVLREDPGALNTLKEALLLWFRKKIDLRHPGQPYAAYRKTYRVLREAALALDSVKDNIGQYQEHWVGPSVAIGIDKSMAEQVWDEALSGGLISLNAEDEWFWRHPFFARALIDGVTAQAGP